ncbi:MAG TPA: hypothetical protein VFO62_10440 [Candidatus Binatia bacterium]|nr:hypothetical protein [Candidatus Binatia bacterium]
MPTPELGSPVQAEPRRGRRHRASDEPIGTLDERVRVLEGDRKAWRGRIWTALVAALGSVGTVIVWALNARDATLAAREAAGFERAKSQELTRDVERLRTEVDALRGLIYAPVWRRTDQPAAPAQLKDPSP